VSIYAVNKHLRQQVVAPRVQVLVAPDDPEDLIWQDQALCAQVDPAIFFLEKGDSAVPAKRVCRKCDVRAECLEYALETDQAHGVWGGMTVRDRRRLQRQRAANSTTTPLKGAA